MLNQRQLISSSLPKSIMKRTQHRDEQRLDITDGLLRKYKPYELEAILNSYPGF